MQMKGDNFMNMFKPTKATSIKEYLTMLVPERREAIEFLHAFIQKTCPKLKPHFPYNMIGYGNFKYINNKKQSLDWPVIALASQKNYISIYVCAIDEGKYVTEKYKKELGKVSVGKSCIRLKKVEDVDLAVLKKVLLLAQKMPGLVSSAQKK